MPQTLEYAAPRDAAAPWGPVLVRPSRRSVLLLLLIAAVAGWVGLRHEPWRFVATVDVPRDPRLGSRVIGAFHLQDDYLLTTDRDVSQIGVWDAATGRLIRTFGQETGAEPGYPIGYYVAGRGRAIFARSLGRNTAELLDPVTGRVLRRTEGSVPPGRIFDVWPGPEPVVLYAEETAVADGKVNTTTFGLWRPFDAAARNPVHTFVLPAATTGRFSPDGRTVLFTSDAPMPIPSGLPPEVQAEWEMRRQLRGWNLSAARLYDVATGKLLADLPGRSPRTEPVFSDDGRVLLSVFDPMPASPLSAGVMSSGFAQPPVGGMFRRTARPATPRLAATVPTTVPAAMIERHSARTGELLSANPPPPGLWRIVPLADGGRALLVPAPGAAPYNSAIVDLRGSSGMLAPGAWRGSFVHYAAAFPDGRRMVVADGSRRYGGIYDADSGQPLAGLPGMVGGIERADVSPDGRRVAVSDNGGLRLYRKVGLECRESHLGVLGMPHVWLLGGLLVALVFSLRADARRSSSAAFLSPAASVLALLILVLALPRTFHAVLAGLTGEWLMTPAPLLLACAIGLCGGGRFWRLATLVVLACLLPLDAYCTFAVRRAGFLTPYPLEVIDRTFEIPRLIVFCTMALFTGLIVPALVLLVRPPRRID